MSEIDVRDNASESRYELVVDSAVMGSLYYRAEPNAITLVHTEVDPALEGEGLVSRLVRSALDDVRARGLRLVPICPFVRSYLERHPEYADLSAPPSAA